VVSSVEWGKVMEVKLIVVGGKNAGQTVPVSGPKFFIGRSEDCHLRPNSDLVSRHHCAILVEDGFVAVRDFGSKNGTFVNGQRVKGEQELTTGDELRVGALRFEVQLVVEMAGKKKPKVHSVEEAAARTAGAAGDDEVDLSDWLGEEAPSGDTTIIETRTLDTPVADTVAEKAVETPPSPTPEKKQHEKDAAHGKKPVGLPKSKKLSARDSQSAAADTLKHLFGR